MGPFDEDVERKLKQLGLGDKPRYVAARVRPVMPSPTGDFETVSGVRSVDEALRQITKMPKTKTR